MNETATTDNHTKDIMECIESLFGGRLKHDGFGDMRIEVRILKRGQKEVIVHCGKQYRFVVDCPCQHCHAERSRSNEKQKQTVHPKTAHQIADFS